MKPRSLLLVLLALAVFPCAALGDCPITVPSSSPVAVPGNTGPAWYGSEALAVQLPVNGQWRGLGAAHHYRNKTWFWRRGYDAASEARPDLTVAGVKVGDDSSAQQLHVGRATNAMGASWQQMLVLVEFPSAGCWQVTATYTYAGITQDLTFVVQVVDESS
jgi:hypothetical protein